jgi:putative ABC transport system permease protein
MPGLLSDARFGFRALRANPTFVVLAVLCLAIGIGASAMTFTAIRASLLAPWGRIDSRGLVDVAEAHRTAPNQWWPASLANLRDWQASVAERAQIGAFRMSGFLVGLPGSEARVDGAYATDNLFAVLGVAPLHGRDFEAGDAAAGSAPVVVLSENYWRQQLGGDAAIVGRALNLDGTPHTVVGVAPALLDIGIPVAIRSARVWIPIRADSQLAARGDRSWNAFARLAAGVSVESFTAQLDGIATELAAVNREDDGWGVRVEPVSGNVTGGMRSLLPLSLGAAVLVLLIACANVANLTLAHATQRRHEFAIRAAIGAAPSRLAMQLLCESLAVATLGAALGLVLARAGLDALVRFYAADTLAPAALPIDWSSMAFTVALTFVTTVVVGLFPALDTARVATRARIAESGSGTTAAPRQERLRRSLVVAQVAASLVLLVGAALLSESFLNLLAVDGGVETARVTSIRVEAREAPAGRDDAARYVARIEEALSALPGVESAAATANLLPLRGGMFRSSVALPSDAEAAARPPIAYTGVTPSFFDTLEIPLLRGRRFENGDQGGRTAVINERLANQLWPNEDALGRQFRLDADAERGWITVVGVSRDVLTWDSNGAEPLPMAFLDLESFAVYPVFFFIRQANAAQVVSAGAISAAIETLNLPLRRIVVTPMERVARDPFWRQQLFSSWLGIFGVAATILTAAGVYGVLSFLVWQRWREIGVRMALGANRNKVLWLVFRAGVVFVGSGLVIGLAIAFFVARAMRGLLFGVEPLDLPRFIAVAALLALIAVAASVAPALRAVRVDPNVLLRS